MASLHPRLAPLPALRPLFESRGARIPEARGLSHAAQPARVEFSSPVKFPRLLDVTSCPGFPAAALPTPARERGRAGPPAPPRPRPFPANFFGTCRAQPRARALRARGRQEEGAEEGRRGGPPRPATAEPLDCGRCRAEAPRSRPRAPLVPGAEGAGTRAGRRRGACRPGARPRPRSRRPPSTQGSPHARTSEAAETCNRPGSSSASCSSS